MNVYTYRVASTTVWTLQVKKIPKLFDIIVQNSRNSRFKQAKIVKKAPISAQILSAIKSNEQLLNDSQCNG